MEIEGTKFSFEPIGFLRSGGGDYRQQSPHQGALGSHTGVIELLPGKNFEVAIADLAGVDYIWLIYVFDRNHTWKPKVLPPIGNRRIGVFATRSPHRPNPIGLSAVRLLKVEGRKLYIADHDLLNGTAVLDIKPYLKDADSFPDANVKWRDDVKFLSRKLSYTREVEKQLQLLASLGAPDFAQVAEAQLALRELDGKRQRICIHQDGSGELAFRTWRLLFHADDKEVTLLSIKSGYSESELAACESDPYRDKEIHRKYIAALKNI